MSTTTAAKKPGREAEFDQDRVRDLSEAVYRDRLGSDLQGMLEKDADGGVKLRERAASYDALSRSYLRAFSAKGTA